MTRTKDLTPNDKRIIAVMFAVLMILLMLSCASDTESKGYLQHDPITVVKIDSCEYIGWRFTLVHKANCNNPTHTK
jgi:hypothetical protein